MHARLFVLHTAEDARDMLAFVKAHAGEQARIGKPIAVRLSVYRPKGSDAQRGLLWVWLEHVSLYAVVRGERFSAEAWHCHFKREFLPDETRAGVAKWRHLPNGDRELAMSTEDLDHDEKNEYLTRLQVYAAEELGLQLESNRENA